MTETGPVTLSVVLVNYNYAHYIAIALEAILAQTRPADEIVIVDDCSTDSSVETITPFLSRHPDIRLVRNEKNIGAMATTNRGLGLVRGDLLFVASSDDAVYPELFEVAAGLMQRHPEAALFNSRTELIDGEGRSLGVLPAPMPLGAPGHIPPREAAAHLMRDDGWFSGASAVWRRSHLAAIGGFPPELGAYADGYLSRLLTLRHGCCYTPEVLGRWRRAGGGMAWTAASQFERTRPLLDEIERRMERERDVFPEGYPLIWRNREIFSLRRFALTERRKAARARGLVPWIAALGSEAVQTLWLLATLRPRDGVQVLTRRLRARAATRKPG